MAINLFADTCEQVDSICNYMSKKSPESMWMFDVQKAYWDDLRDAQKNGKKVIFFGGPAPVQLMYAFDCIPFFLDMMPTRIASKVDVTARYVDEAEKYVPATVCGLDKVELGIALLGEYGLKPDGFSYCTVPCDSARVSHPAMDKIFGVPSYKWDIPFRRDERATDYLAGQYDNFIKWLEEITGKKLDWEKFKEVAKISNETDELLWQIAQLRMQKPCPLPGRLLVLNELAACMTGHPAMLEYMKKQYEVGKYNLDNGIGACKEEKYRVSWLQNIIWANVSILDWMEQKYGAVMVMDGFGYQKFPMFEDLDDIEHCKKVMANKCMSMPMIHGASGPAHFYVKMIEEIMDNYDVNVSMFIGHVGCKHTFAAAKMVEDMIQDKFKIPTLNLELDSIDQRYKGMDEVKATISEYMESVVGAEPFC